MQATKLITLLKTLDVAEFRRLHQFLQSPYYNYHKQILALYQYLRKFYPDFDTAHLDREKVFQKLFPDESFNLKKLRKLTSVFTLLVEEYFLTLVLQQDSYQKKKLLGHAFRQRNLSAYYQKNVRELIGELQDAPFRNQAYYLDLIQLNQDLFFHPGTDKQNLGTSLLEEAMQHLDAFFLLAKLQLSAEMKTRENILAEEHDILLLEECILLSRQSLATQNPLYLIYLHILDLHQDAAVIGTLLSMITLFKAIIPSIDRRERQLILHHLLNHAIRLINQGKSESKKALFELYQLGIAHQLLIENGRISEVTFSNIVAIGASLGAFEWVKNFMDQYGKSLEEEVREDTQALGLALWHFNKKEYDLTIKALLGHHFSNILNLLKSRSLLIRTYFEQFLLDDTYYSFLLDQSNAFEKFIRRQKKIAPNKGKGYLNFIKCTKKMVLYKYNKQETTPLQHELHKLSVVTHKGWLLEKMKELG